MNFLTHWLHRNTVWIEIFENRENLWQWRLEGSNGRILAHSEEYASYGNCMDTVRMLIDKKIRKR